MADAPRLLPTSPAERYHLLDVVRGFALIGVLLINMEDTAGFGVTPGGRPRDLLNEILGMFFQFFVEGRFRGLFGLLFGIGFTLQIMRARERGAPFMARYFRRAALLFLFGLFHFLFYPGDILVRYAVVGLLLIPSYRLSDRAALILAAVLILSIPVLRQASSVVPPIRPSFMTEACTSLPEKYGGGSEVYTYGTFLEVRQQLACRFPGELRYWITRLHPFRILALFLLGMVIGRTALYRRVEECREFVWRLVLWTAFLGFLLISLEDPLALSAHGSPTVMHRVARVFIQEVGTTLTTLTYAGLLALLFQGMRGRSILMPLAAVGRMALTVYIGQSLIYSTLFSGYGMGWNQSVGRVGLLGLTVVIFSIEIVLCNLWLRYYRYGPLEWVWRCATYMKWLPMRV